MSTIRPLGFLGGIALTSGCATLFAGGPDRIPVSSNPSGAAVTVDGNLLGVTPMVVTLDRGSSQGVIRFEAAGYEPVVVQRTKEFNTIALLNNVMLLAWLIDLATENVKRFDSTSINVSLARSAQGAPGSVLVPGAPGTFAPPPPPAPVAPTSSVAPPASGGQPASATR